ncbi:unconventional myosin-X-like isoform X5 [Branchiostoma lanceolatum]|uniref:unconventional myosin-X-like isoform X5 n=1 Tax=Branchiostoma lanceolatum TaxID=7740 RepID=UPI003455D550
MAAQSIMGCRVQLWHQGQWQPASVDTEQDDQVTYTTDAGQSVTYPLSALTHDLVRPMQDDNMADSVEDMANLSDLNEGSILENIRLRYVGNRIYTYIGHILCAVNPYKPIEDLYSKGCIQAYKKKHIGDLPPHIFAIANECYYAMWKAGGENQCILISGESGAGKTESTKFILQFLSEMSQVTGGSGEGSTNTSVEQAILQSSPIMEAFGNAKTVYNNNSSRFGKFIQLQFNEKGSITGGRIQDYLLEKNRVVGQNPEERNYHIFYSLMAGSTSDIKEVLCLTEASDFHYLNRSGCINDPTINDQEDFSKVLHAMRVMNFSEKDILDVWCLLASILHVGNIKFVTTAGAQVADKQGFLQDPQECEALSNAASLLRVDMLGLAEALTQRSIFLRGELISTPLEVNEAADSRDSLAMNLYKACFRWIITKINSRIYGNGHYSSIGVLDIFGFENFKTNRFEQFNINYANEKLQEYFNKHIFSLEQLEYNREGIVWTDIDWVDNGECLDLVERKLGILDLLDEESRFPKGTDNTFVDKLHGGHKENAFFLKPKVASRMFGIKHYAGEVYYDTQGFLEKNRDTFRDDILNILQESRSDFIYELFDTDAYGNGTSLKSGTATRQRKKPTVSSQFKESLRSLMTTLSAANPFFVRCIKPNSQKLPDTFDPELVLSQLRYSGMLETVRIRRAGYPVRRTFDDFCYRYRVLMRQSSSDEDIKTHCSGVLQLVDDTGKEWQLGKTKVFLRERLECELEKRRESELHRVATIIQAGFKGHQARKQFHRAKQSVVIIQKNYKAHFWRKAFVQVRQATITLQKFERSRRARHLLQHLREERRLEEERQHLLRLEEKKQREEEEKIKEEEERRLLEQQTLEEKAKFEEKKRLEEERKKPCICPMCGSRREMEKQEEIREQEQKVKEKQELRKLEFEVLDELDNLIEECMMLELGRSDIDDNLDDKLEDWAKAKQELAMLRAQQAEEARLAEEAKQRALEEEKRFEEFAKKKAKEDAKRMEQEAMSRQNRPTRLLLQSKDTKERRLRAEAEQERRRQEAQRKWNRTLSTKKGEEKRESVDSMLSESDGTQERSSLDESGDELDMDLDDESPSSPKRHSLLPEVTPYFHAYLMMKGGVMNTWKRRWCVLKDDTLMWYRGKQASIKSGWLAKKGGGTGTLSRRSWKTRWFVLRGTTLSYHENDEEGAKQLGSIDVKSCKEILDNGLKENSLSIVTEARTYHLVAETPEEASQWYNVLTSVYSANDEELREMQDEQANPKNAAGTLDVALIDSVYASDNESKPHQFVIITANRVFTCCSDTAEEMHHWISCLQRSKGDVHSGGQDFITRGWLSKETGKPTGTVNKSTTLKKRWFVLTAHSLDYYKSSDTNSQKLGTLILDSLCRVVQADSEMYEQTGYYMFTIHGRRRSFHLFTKLHTEVQQWVQSLQEVIDSKVPIVTPTQQLITDLRDASMNSEAVDQIYQRNPILRHTPHPLKTPLLPLPYGDVNANLQKEKGYTNLQEEAVKIFNSLLQIETAADQISIVQNILETCHDLKYLKDEVYCQLIKQTMGVADVDSIGNLRVWQIMACMCCAFQPTRNVIRYLKFHLKRCKEKFPITEMAKFATFCGDSLRRCKGREYVPSRDEVIAILGRRDMYTTVHCYGSSCRISINSSTTASEVVQRLVRGMNLEETHNTFALFERGAGQDKAIDGKAIVADILAKFEQLKEEEETDWKLFFRLFCFMDPRNVPTNSLEYDFMFEQAHEDVIHNRFPSSEETLQYLAAYRLQYKEGDFSKSGWTNDLGQVYPMERLRRRVKSTKENIAPVSDKTERPATTKRKSNFLEGTLRRSFGKGGHKKARQQVLGEDAQLVHLLKEEESSTTSAVIAKWKMLKGLTKEEAQQRYMRAVMDWSGYGATLFDVECFPGKIPRDILSACKDRQHPVDLWLAVSVDEIALYKRGEERPLASYAYDSILSFGAPVPNTYKIVVEDKEPMMFETSQVVEIAKLMKAYINSLVKKRYSWRTSYHSYRKSVDSDDILLSPAVTQS